MHHGPCCSVYFVNYHSVWVTEEIAHLVGPGKYYSIPGHDVFHTSQFCLSQALGIMVGTHVADATKSPGTHSHDLLLKVAGA